jgi:fatty-acyl-CoA synthase
VTPADAPLERRLVSQGPPLDGNQIEIRDAAGQVLGARDVGIIHIRGRISPGYRQSDGSVEPIVGEDGYYNSGDEGFLDEDGWLTYTGRAGDMIKTSGINVSPFEVEEVLVGHPDVKMAVVVGVPDEVRGELVTATVSLAANSDLTSDELIAYCKVQLASYKVPRTVTFVDAMPQTGTGKLDRRAVKARMLKAAE